MSRGKGYKPDPQGHRKTPFAQMLALRGKRADAPTPSASLDLIDVAPAVFDQGQTSSCVGHAIAAAIDVRLEMIGANRWVPSPRGIYTVARCLDRVGLAPLEDGGAEPNQGIRAVSEWGIRPMIVQASDGRFSDCDPATINAEPTLGELEQSSTLLVLGAYAITSTGAQREQEIRTAIAAGFPVTFALEGSSIVFENYSGGVLESLGVLLDHYVVALGYETRGGETVLRCRNSWGESWGESGMFRLGEQGIAELGDLYVFDVREVLG